MDKSWCCFIDPANDKSCGKDAEVMIAWHPSTPDNYTESCLDHIGKLLPEDRHATISPIEQ